MRRKLIVLSAIFGLLAVSGVASAVTEEDTGPEPDTNFNFGYDEGNSVFVWRGSDIAAECTIENGEVQVTYIRVGDHLLVEDLEAIDDCAISGEFVAGPQGQINHGMFMKLFNSMFSGPGRGCLVRHLAQSELGMGDQQVNVDGGETEVETQTETVDPDTGTIVFENVTTKCNHGPAVADSETEDDDNGPPAHAARPDNAGPPDQIGGTSGNAPGKSGAAPGRNK